ncbi:sodium:solute symporter family transporter [Brevibacterium aurantiacum]|nr:sodium:solute symporter family protein [Brevibacterium aurantiacum]
MGAVVNAMSYGAIDLKVAAIVSFIVAEAFILFSGLRGSAWVSVLKDGLVILAVAFLAIYVPLHYFDGLAPLLDRVVSEKSQWLTFPGAGDGIYGGAWFISTIILNGITITVFPTSIAGYLSGTSANALRRNSIILPWYQLLLLVPMMVGVAALFVVPALKDADLALFSVVIDSLPAPIVAIIGVAGALSAIVPMSVYMLSIGSMWGRTVLGGGLAGPKHAASMTSEQLNARGLRQKTLSQWVCLAVGIIALIMSLLMPDALVELSVLSYEGLAQVVPAALLSLYWPRMSKQAAAAGLIVGSVVMVALHYTGLDPLLGINGGLWSVAANLIVVVIVTLVKPDPRWAPKAQRQARTEAAAL